MIYKSIGNKMNDEKIREIFQTQKKYKEEHFFISVKERKKKLKLLMNSVISRTDEITKALNDDFGKAPAETKLTEIFPAVSEIREALRNVERWTSPKRARTPLSFWGTIGKVLYEPKGVVLIISPWNYPFLLAVGPLVSAIAAGNGAIVKPSEFTPNVLSVLEKIISEVFEPREVAVVSGDAETGEYLTSLPFDHIFFTGGTAIGKKVMKAAAENLTSVTLELGGKSPVILDESADIKDAARKIAWGKLINAGQTCIAPDYLLLPKNVENEFVSSFKNAVNEIFGGGETFESNVDYCRLIHRKHFTRIKLLLDDALSQGAETLFPVNFNEERNFFSPNLIRNVNWKMKIMREEIFGPLLPVIAYSDFDEIKKIVNKNRSPLSLYVFSKKKKFIDDILKEIPAGSTAVNGVVVQFANGNLPFGGRNGSGMGKAHGYYGFKTFSNEKSSLKQTSLSPLKYFYPPYTKTKEKLIDLLIKYF